MFYVIFIPLQLTALDFYITNTHLLSNTCMCKAFKDVHSFFHGLTRNIVLAVFKFKSFLIM